MDVVRSVYLCVPDQCRWIYHKMFIKPKLISVWLFVRRLGPCSLFLLVYACGSSANTAIKYSHCDTSARRRPTWHYMLCTCNRFVQESSWFHHKILISPARQKCGGAKIINSLGTRMPQHFSQLQFPARIITLFSINFQLVWLGQRSQRQTQNKKTKQKQFRLMALAHNSVQYGWKSTNLAYIIWGFAVGFMVWIEVFAQ